ncbi:hypothetical protein ACEQ8H_008063 [Pleosporales sp. CAS-2024a]
MTKGNRDVTEERRLREEMAQRHDAETKAKAKLHPVSYLMALLQQSLEKLKHTMTLTCFCGLNTDTRDAQQSSGPTCMAKTMLGQALAIHGLHRSEEEDANPLLSFLRYDHVQHMQANHYDAYLKTLARLLKTIAPQYSAIFILVDAIDFYDNEWEDEVVRFLNKVKRLVRVFNKRKKHKGSSGVLKMLMSASSQSSHFLPFSDNFQLLHMPEDVEGDEKDFEEFRDSDG